MIALCDLFEGISSRSDKFSPPTSIKFLGVSVFKFENSWECPDSVLYILLRQPKRL